VVSGSVVDIEAAIAVDAERATEKANIGASRRLALLGGFVWMQMLTVNSPSEAARAHRDTVSKG